MLQSSPSPSPSLSIFQPSVFLPVRINPIDKCWWNAQDDAWPSKNTSHPKISALKILYLKRVWGHSNLWTKKKWQLGKIKNYRPCKIGFLVFNFSKSVYLPTFKIEWMKCGWAFWFQWQVTFFTWVDLQTELTVCWVGQKNTLKS